MTDLLVTRWGARFDGRCFPCAIGSGGIGHKRGEGDGITPRGHWRLMEVWHRPDRLRLPPLSLPVRAIAPGDLWSDDPADPAYNHHVRAPHGFSHERLRRADPLYDLLAVTDFNWPDATPGGGSAIFLHVWRKPRHPTAGCVAMRLDDLVGVLARWDARCRVVIR